MLSRALILAAVAFALGCFGAIPADAQNLEAGKPPSQIFSSTCSLCHKSARGLLKSVSPGSLPGFLRQHYTTSTDMAAAMSAYVLSNGAANAAVGGGNLTKQGQEAKGGAATSQPGAEPTGRGRKQREAAKPDADGLQGNTPPGAGRPESALTARQKAAAERRAARLAAKSKGGKDELPPKDEARHEAPKDDAAKTETAKTEPSKTESAKTESPKAEGTRPDPVPAVTPAPATTEKGPDTAAIAPPKPVVDDPNRPLTIDLGPAPTPPQAAPAAVAASGPPPAPAGKPEPPISR
ncbi:MAG: hypothetical protein ACRC9K_11295 [Afipia sp.]